MSSNNVAHDPRPALAWGLATILWAALIFGLSAQPNLTFAADPGWDFVIRKIGHMGVFGLLALLVWRTLADARIGRPVATAFLLTVMYAATDEVHQGFTVGRHPALTDVGIDAVGAAIALLVGNRVLLRWRRSA